MWPHSFKCPKTDSQEGEGEGGCPSLKAPFCPTFLLAMIFFYLLYLILEEKKKTVTSFWKEFAGIRKGYKDAITKAKNKIENILR